MNVYKGSHSAVYGVRAFRFEVMCVKQNTEFGSAHQASTNSLFLIILSKII